MRIVHTADWHIGALLYQHKRYEEWAAFLDWLAAWLADNGVDVLLIAGDIFDTTTPSNRAQELYYRFLCSLTKTPLRHVVITAGNHDSPSFLEAPSALLRLLHIHVVAQATENCADEVIPLYAQDGSLELIVCAVPYLRDRDVRTALAGETYEEKEEKLRLGIAEHYAQVAEEALRVRGDSSVPIIAMGHLFAAGGKTVEGDGVRELYVGKLARVAADCFSPLFDYVALGHLHVPQTVGGCSHIRYSGSPLPIGFGEADQEKSLSLVTFTQGEMELSSVPIPRWQKLAFVRGDLEEIGARIRDLSVSAPGAWLEILYTGSECVADLQERVYAMLAQTTLTALCICQARTEEKTLVSEQGERLEELTVEEVFRRCLDEHGIVEADRPALLAAYREVLREIAERDVNES